MRREDLVVRLGGEEIAVIAVLPVPLLTNLAERVRRQVEVAGADRKVTVSLGVAWSEPPPDGTTTAARTQFLRTLVAQADDRMCAAKRAGRTQVCVGA